MSKRMVDHVLHKKVMMKMKRILPTCFALFLLCISGCSEDEPLTNITGFKLNNRAFAEGSQENTVQVSIIAEGVINSEVQVGYMVQENTARFNDDVLGQDGTLVFNSGSNEQIIELTIVGDTHFELTESFAIQLEYEGSTTNLLVDIEDDDPVSKEIEEDSDGFLTPAEYPSMTKVWADEFDGSSLNTAYWNYEIGDGCPDLCGWGNNELQSYTNDPVNISVEGGQLTITAIKDEGNFTSARIQTKDKVEPVFGRIDIRAKLPKGQGIWPALWMLGANIDNVSWPACGEIDIMEIVGHEPAVTHGTVHFEDDGAYRTSTRSKELESGDFSDKFHVFSIIWEPNGITWYLDNQPFKIFSGAQINNFTFNIPFFFVMNVAVGGNWPGNPDNTTVFPQSMEVDYIRVFQ